MVPHRKLLYANATIDMMFEGGNIIGMGLAGILIALMTAAGTLMANAALFIFAGIALFFIKKEELNITPNEATSFNLIQDFKDGLSYIFGNQAILIIYSIQLFVFLEYLTAPVLLAPYARNILHANAAQFGYIEAALSVGAVTGGLFLSWFADRFGLMRTMLISTIISGIAYVYFSINHSIITAEALYFILGVCFAMWPLIITRAQHITDIDYQGRVQSCFNSLSGILMILTYWGVKIISQYTSIEILYWIEIFFALVSIVLIVYFEWRFDEKNEERP
jgi:predicted MFS family arabinose efflux permease